MKAGGIAALGDLFVRAFKGWSADSAPSMGAALAFYTLFSLAPLLVLVIAITGLVIGHDAAQQLVLAQLSGLLGDTGAQGVKSVLDATSTHKDGMVATAVSLATLALGATTVFAELRDDLDRIWHCEAPKGSALSETFKIMERRLLKERLRSLLAERRRGDMRWLHSSFRWRFSMNLLP